MGFSAQVQQSMIDGNGKGSSSNYQANLPETKPIQTNWDPQPLDGVNSGYFPTAPKPMGKGGAQTNSATSGQPTIGAPNKYSNTVGQWDNTQQQTQSHFGGGKGKG